MRKFCVVFIILILIIPTVGQSMEMVSGEIPPYSSEKQGAHGIAIDLVKEVFKRAGMEINIVFKPWPVPSIWCRQLPRIKACSSLR